MGHHTEVIFSGLKKRAAGRRMDTVFIGLLFNFSSIKRPAAAFAPQIFLLIELWFKELEGGELLPFSVSGCKYDAVIVTLSPFFVFLSSSPSLPSDSRSFLLLFGQAFGSRDSYFSSTFTRDIYSRVHIVLVLTTRHLMRLAQPLDHVFAAFTCRWKFSDSP